MAKRRSRIAYAPRSRRKRSGTDKNQSASFNEKEIKESTRKNKQGTHESASTCTSVESSQQQHRKRKKARDSSTKEKSSPHKRSSSEQTEDTKKRIYQKRKQTVKADAAPERIRDMTVTKKTYAKWKPLSLSTKKYTKQVLESTMLSVLNSVGKESKKGNIQVHLKQLSERIIKRLDNIKGPTQKGDYSKMEAESNDLEDAVISCNRQIEALEKELEEQTKLFEQDEQMLNSCSDQVQELQQQKQPLHPLLQIQPANTLNLPSLSSETHKMSSVCELPTSLEGNGRRLAQSLAKLSDQAEKLGFTNWLETLADRANP